MMDNPARIEFERSRVQQTGLKSWPETFKQDRILSSVDLDNNNITSLGSRPINIRTGLLNLEFNYIESIDEFTFNGSEIAILKLSGNRKLSSIHPNAFANLQNLISLYLSNTSVIQLPSAGFHNLRSLHIRDTPALKRIPSIYAFPMLESAELTYAYHCCSFRYPKTHDPSAYEEHLRIQEQINALCANRRDHVALANSQASQVHSSSSDFEGYFEAEQKVPTGPGVKVELSVLSSGDLSSSSSVIAAATTPSSSSSSSSSSLPPSSSPSSSPASPPELLVAAATSHLKGQGSRLIGNGAGRLAKAEGQAASSAQQQQQQQQQQQSSAQPATTLAGQSSQTDSRNQSVLDPPLKRLFPTHTIECGELADNRAGQNINCTPEPTAFEPCEDIMGYTMLRIAVWFVVAASLFGNLSVIVVLMGVFRRLSVPKFLQLNLAIGDLFMGVYLAMLAFADITTVGSYFNYALDWQHGYGCKIAGAASLFASQLSIFTLSVITFERYYTITYSIDLNMRLQLGWAARIMFLGWLYAFGSAMLPIFADINSYTMTSICLPTRTTYLEDRIYIVVLLFIDAFAFVIILACYLKMYLLIVRQKTEATAKERTIAKRMALLVSTDFACWAPIIFFGTTAFFGHPLISLTNSKILIVFFYPLNSMANPFLYVISTRQYRRDLNYLTGRWQMWRKNLFKKSNESFFSNNAAYGAAQYPPGNLTAHLGAVAAVTGVANHLLHNHIEVPINIAGGGGGGGCSANPACELHHSHRHHGRHRHHQHHNQNNKQQQQHQQIQLQQGANGGADGCALNATKLHEQRIVCTKSHQGQYIIRHQILTDRCVAGPAGERDGSRKQRGARFRFARSVKQQATNNTGGGGAGGDSPPKLAPKQLPACAQQSSDTQEHQFGTEAAATTINSAPNNTLPSATIANNLTVIAATAGANNLLSSVLEGSPALLLVETISDETSGEARQAADDNSTSSTNELGGGGGGGGGSERRICSYEGHAHDGEASPQTSGLRENQWSAATAATTAAQTTTTFVTATACDNNDNDNRCCSSNQSSANLLSPSSYRRSQSSSGATDQRHERAQRLLLTGKATTAKLIVAAAAASSTTSSTCRQHKLMRQSESLSTSHLPSETLAARVGVAKGCHCGRNKRDAASGRNRLIVLASTNTNGQRAEAPEEVACEDGAAEGGGGSAKTIDILGNLSYREPTSSASGLSSPPRVSTNTTTNASCLSVSAGDTDKQTEPSERADELGRKQPERAECGRCCRRRCGRHQQHHHQRQHQRACCRLKRTRCSHRAGCPAELADSSPKEAESGQVAAATTDEEQAAHSHRCRRRCRSGRSDEDAQHEHEHEQQHHQQHNHHHHHHHHHYRHHRHHHHRRRRGHHSHDRRHQRHHQHNPEALARDKSLAGCRALAGASQSIQVEDCEQQAAMCCDKEEAKEEEEASEEDCKLASDEATVARSRVTITPQASVIVSENGGFQIRQPQPQPPQLPGKRKELESILKQPTRTPLQQQQQRPRTTGSRLLGLFRGSSLQSGGGGGDSEQRANQKGQKRVSIMASHHSN